MYPDYTSAREACRWSYWRRAGLFHGAGGAMVFAELGFGDPGERAAGPLHILGHGRRSGILDLGVECVLHPHLADGLVGQPNSFGLSSNQSRSRHGRDAVQT